MQTKTAKIATTLDADHALDRVLAKVNDGFTGGRVTKNDLASWILIHFEQHMDSSIEKIRKDHFDQVAYLESVVKEMKRAKKAGESKPDIATLLAPIATEIKSISARKKLRSEQEEKVAE